MADKINLGGVTNTTMYLENDGTVFVEEKQDAEGILDYTHAARNHRFDADVCDGMMRHVAEVPAVDYFKWCREANVTPFTPAADVVMELQLRKPENARLLAAPTVRDPRIIMKGRR